MPSAPFLSVFFPYSYPSALFCLFIIHYSRDKCLISTSRSVFSSTVSLIYPGIFSFFLRDFGFGLSHRAWGISERTGTGRVKDKGCAHAVWHIHSEGGRLTLWSILFHRGAPGQSSEVQKLLPRKAFKGTPSHWSSFWSLHKPELCFQCINWKCSLFSLPRELSITLQPPIFH